jgi:GTP-binding protein
VGKSSLINALTRTKDLARTSKTPGRTQQVNYFAFVPNENQRDPSSMSHTSTSCAQKNTPPVAYLIDLPGYGYAEAPVDQVGRWQDTTQDFLQNRRDVGVLKRLYVLVDSRHGVSMSDRAVLGWLDDAEIPYCVVFTKADRIGRPMIIRYANDICMRYHSQFYNQNYVSETVNPSDGTCLVQGSQGCQSPLVHVTSSKTGQGIHELMWTMHWDLFDPTRLSTKIKVAIE